MKKILVFLTAVLVLISFCGCNSENTVTVRVAIDCSEILANYDDLAPELKNKKYVPSDGVILEEVSVNVKENATALDVLKAVSKEHGISIDVSGGYAKSINHIGEKACGPMSGWVYEVNNEMIMDQYTVSEDDLITWKFVCSFE